jgi:hypothetical protein
MQLLWTFERAMSFKETDPDQALTILREGRQQAQSLQEPRWVLFFDHWQLQILLFHKFDYRAILDLAVRAVVEACQPSLADFPQRVCLHEDLIFAYATIDPIGYADRIEQALDYMRREITPGMECVHCIEGCRAHFELSRERWDEARTCALRALSLADDAGSAHYAASAYQRLCLAAWYIKDLTALADWAVVGEAAAVRSDRRSLIAEFILWQAVTARHTRDEGSAQRLLRSAGARMNRLAVPPSEEYFEALCGFHELGGKITRALHVRDKQLATVADSGQLAYECRVRLRRCRLLVQLGQLQPADRESAREAVRKLRAPASYLQELDRIGGP